MGNNTFAVNDVFQEVDTRTVDERNRITLGDLLKGYRRVRLYENDRGEVLLQPIGEIPADELWLYESKEDREAVLKGIKDASEGKISRLNLDDL